MPFHSHHGSNTNHSLPNTASGLFQASGSLGAIAAPNLQRLASGNATTSAGTDTFAFHTPAQLANLPDPNSSGGGVYGNAPRADMAAPAQQQMGGVRGGYDGGLGVATSGQQLPMSAPVSAVPSESQQFASPSRRHTQRISEDLRAGSNATSTLPVTPQQQGGPFDTGAPYSASAAPAFHLQQATPQNTQSAGVVVPSNAYPQGVPGSLQPAGGAQRPGPPISSNTAPAVPTLQSQTIQTNMQQYTQTQPPSRTNTLHSHSRSSPAGMDGSNSANSKYIPFNQTPTQTPTSSRDPRGFSALSPQTPHGAASHSPLNLSDVRTHALYEGEGSSIGLGTNQLFKYSVTATNSNYLAPFPTYAYDWCKWPVLSSNSNSAGKMAVGSYLEDPHNFIQILESHIVHQEGASSGQSQYGLEYSKVAEATCAYPVTRILWEPPSSQKQSTDLLATSGDHLRLWSVPQNNNPQMSSNNVNRSAAANAREQQPQKLQPLALLSNSKTPEHTAPLTSLDWNTLSPKLIITSSIDTTCTIWDIPTLTAKTQLIAHDKEVFDVRFCAGSVDVFVSCGADGSVRMFDLRSLEHSTIIYEPAEKADPKGSSPTSSSPTKSATQHTLTQAPPLLRLAASPHDAHLLATFASDSNVIRILDVRQPGTALLELRGHSGSLNAIEWNPNRRGMLASGADDSLVLVWDLMGAGGQIAAPVNGVGNGTNQSGASQVEVQGKGPTASWKCEYEVSNVSWAPQSALTGQGGDWLGVCAGRGIWSVKL